MNELIKSVLLWWEEHQYDTGGDGGEYNVYDETPEFVEIAQRMKDEEKP